MKGKEYRRLPQIWRSRSFKSF